MPNAVRGEVEIELNGKKYILRPDFEAIAEIEDRLGIGIHGLMFKFAEKKSGIKDVAGLIYGGLIGAGCHDFTFTQVGNMIRKAGFNKFVSPAVTLLANALRGDEDEETAPGNEKPLEVMPETPAGQPVLQ